MRLFQGWVLRIFKNAWFNRFARKEGLTDSMLSKVIQQAEAGLIDIGPFSESCGGVPGVIRCTD
jgi:hypothetical protein